MRPRHRSTLTVLLGVVSGATDAIGFLALGGAFTSVMTGNLVLLGVHLTSGDLEALAPVVLAIAAFTTGAAVGAHTAGRPDPSDPTWPPHVTRSLMIELAIFCAYGIAWWWTATDTGALTFAMLVGNAFALGLQSSAMQRFGVSGLSTTYLTGTLTTTVTALVSGHGLRAVAPSAGIIAGLVAGAAGAAVLLAHAERLAPLLQIVPLIVVIVAATLTDRGRRTESAFAD